ncbi:MAG: 4Fe-4S binding protein [Firmicutes bacterium]|nr:4Fe-4S binding protein [Bacillota bacterium]MCL5039390.1 4Fe-4S binding protein [Bacillota bacterium]
MPAKIIEKMCVGCGNCARVCQQEAIKIMAAKAVVDPSRCDDCELCIEQCINGAITFYLADAAGGQ